MKRVICSLVLALHVVNHQLEAKQALALQRVNKKPMSSQAQEKKEETKSNITKMLQILGLPANYLDLDMGFLWIPANWPYDQVGKDKNNCLQGDDTCKPNIIKELTLEEQEKLNNDRLEKFFVYYQGLFGYGLAQIDADKAELDKKTADIKKVTKRTDASVPRLLNEIQNIKSVIEEVKTEIESSLLSQKYQEVARNFVPTSYTEFVSDKMMLEKIEVAMNSIKDENLQKVYKKVKTFVEKVIDEYKNAKSSVSNDLDQAIKNINLQKNRAKEHDSQEDVALYNQVLALINLEKEYKTKTKYRNIVHDLLPSSYTEFVSEDTMLNKISTGLKSAQDPELIRIYQQVQTIVKQAIQIYHDLKAEYDDALDEAIKAAETKKDFAEKNEDKNLVSTYDEVIALFNLEKNYELKLQKTQPEALRYLKSKYNLDIQFEKEYELYAAINLDVRLKILDKAETEIQALLAQSSGKKTLQVGGSIKNKVQNRLILEQALLIVQYEKEEIAKYQSMLVESIDELLANYDETVVGMQKALKTLQAKVDDTSENNQVNKKYINQQIKLLQIRIDEAKKNDPYDQAMKKFNNLDLSIASGQQIFEGIIGLSNAFLSKNFKGMTLDKLPENRKEGVLQAAQMTVVELQKMVKDITLTPMEKAMKKKSIVQGFLTNSVSAVSLVSSDVIKSGDVTLMAAEAGLNNLIDYHLPGIL